MSHNLILDDGEGENEKLNENDGLDLICQDQSLVTSQGSSGKIADVS